MNTDSLLQQRLICVAVIDQPDDAVPLAEALLAGGLNVMEVTFRTATAAESIKRIRNGVPQIAIGAGTLLAPDQVQRAADAGAQFGVSPGLNEAVLAAANKNQMPFFPGVMTPTEVGRALDLGGKFLKFFPAEAAGGVKMLKALAGPFGHTGVKFVPTGGINAASLAGLSCRAAGRGDRRFVDGRAQTRQGKGVGQNHSPHRRGDEGNCAGADEIIVEPRNSALICELR